MVPPSESTRPEARSVSARRRVRPPGRLVGQANRPWSGACRGRPEVALDGWPGGAMRGPLSALLLLLVAAFAEAPARAQAAQGPAAAPAADGAAAEADLKGAVARAEREHGPDSPGVAAVL